MDYKKFGESYYIRFDKGDEIVGGILDICKREKILSATYSGIGGCGDITVATYIFEEQKFLPHNKTGSLEMISLNGNISADDNDNIFEHTHALFSFLDEKGDMKFIGGHLTKAVVLYTAEIVLTPVKDGVIRRNQDTATGITVWKL